MNINTAVMALNVNNILVKKQLDKDQESRHALKINQEVEFRSEIKNVETSNQNLVAAESKINNIDSVEELVKKTKDSILDKSAMALLSQANKRRADVMTLLQ